MATKQRKLIKRYPHDEIMNGTTPQEIEARKNMTDEERLEDTKARMKTWGIKAEEEREEEYYKRYGEEIQERYTGEQVGYAFLVEFIKVYKGSTVSIIPDDKRTKMVNSIDNYEDMFVYTRYRDIYWHYLVKVNEHECKTTEARFWYMKLKLAIADGDQYREDETDESLVHALDFMSWYYSPTGEPPENNLQKIQTIFNAYKRTLYVCRCIEVGVEIISQALGIDDSPFRGMELFGTYLQNANKLVRTYKELGLKPIRKKELEPGTTLIANARHIASFVKDDPDQVNYVFKDMLEI